MADYYNETKNIMKNTLNSLQTNLNTLRTGRASPAVLENIKCDYYGDSMPINQIATIKIPEPRQLLITPYDKNDVKTIVSALNASQLGITPIVDGVAIRLTFPSPTQERRVELTKKAKSYGEGAKVAIRNIRRDRIDVIENTDNIYAFEHPSNRWFCFDFLGSILKSCPNDQFKKLTEDFEKRYENDIQKATDEIIVEIDKIVKTKNDEIMSV